MLFPKEVRTTKDADRTLAAYARTSIRASFFLLFLIIFCSAPSRGEEPVKSSLRYTLEIEFGGQRYVATSVVQTTAYEKPTWLPEIGQRYRFLFQGEGLGLQLPDGRVLVVKFPGYWKPPGFESYKANVVERFVAKGEVFQFQRDATRNPTPPQAIIFDNATSPKKAWQFDYLHPELTLGRGARIVRFDMQLTRDEPTFNLGKVVPWLATDRRESLYSPRRFEDVWFGYDVFRAKLKYSEVLKNSKKITLTGDGSSSEWLDISDAFLRGDWRNILRSNGDNQLISNIERVKVRYSSDLSQITVAPEESGEIPPTEFIRGAEMPRRHPDDAGEQWTPILCISKAGCSDLVGSRFTIAIMKPSDDTVYVLHRDQFDAEKSEFELKQRKP